MSAIAEFRLISTEHLDQLKNYSTPEVKKGLFKKTVTDHYPQFLQENSTPLDDFKWTGHVFGNLLIYLEQDKEIDLLSSEYDSLTSWISENRGITSLIFTFGQKEKYFDKLLPEQIDIEELIKFNVEFSGDDNREFANAEIEGAKAIKKNLGLLEDANSVILLTVS